MNRLHGRPDRELKGDSMQGDPLRAMQARAMFNVIDRDDLLENTRQTGLHLYSGLERFAEQGKISSLRGKE